jgi:thioredoxin-like negative regulator of GroEL
MWKLLLMLLWACGVSAQPLVPRDDNEVIERLPGRRAAVMTLSAPQAATQARALIEQSRAEGDPRWAGRALALLQPWANGAAAPADVVVMLATAEQHLHDFEGAARRLEGLLAREPAHPQAGLTLATLRRVQGRYEASDQACRAIQGGQGLHPAACLAENQALRGQFGPARTQLNRLLTATRDGGSRAWLLTTLAELEERAGQPDAAEQAYRQALAAVPGDGYAALALADLLIGRDRARDALAVLAGQPRSDAVLLRQVISGQRQGLDVARDEAELRQRFEQIALRPGAGHAREQAMFALRVDRNAPRALAAAQANVGLQREPIDLLLLAQAARAADHRAALQQAARLAQEIGLHDRRLDALL